MLQIVVSLTGDSRGVIYDQNIFITQATNYNVTTVSMRTVSRTILSIMTLSITKRSIKTLFITN